jgi:hypothetical protein
MTEEVPLLRVPVVRATSASMAVLAFLALTAAPAGAQAWLPAHGEGTVSLVFQDAAYKYHYFTTEPIDRGHIRSDSLIVDLTYGVTDKLALTVGIPWVAARYRGTAPHQLLDTSGPVPKLYGANPIDDGSFHDTFQDFRFDLRYNVTKKGVVLTPFVGSIVPSHNYEYFAHAAPGRSVRELQVGASAAKLLDSIVPGLFVQGRYAYGFAEEILGISHDRSSMGLEVGYFLTPKLRLLGLSSGQITHGGIDLTLNSKEVLGPILFSHHDQIDRVNFLNLGGGGSYSLTEQVDLFGALIHTVAQRNGHAIEYGLSVGLSWTFSARSAKDRAFASNESSLARCACEKGMK